MRLYHCTRNQPAPMFASRATRTASWAFIKDLRETGGKTAPTPHELLPQSNDHAVPHVDVECQDGRQLRLRDALRVTSNSGSSTTPIASMIGVISRSYGQTMVSQWLAPFLATFCHASGEDSKGIEVSADCEQPKAQALQLSIVESTSAHFIPGFKRLLRHRAPCVKGAVPLFCFNKPQQAAEQLGLANPLSTAMLLVDSDGYIRWRASGAPSDDELQRMHKCAARLIRGAC